MYKFFQILVWPFYRLFHPIKVIGKNNIPKGRAILVCNHYSNSDPVVLGTAIFRQQHFLGKKELFQKKGIAKWFLKVIGAVPIDRQNVDLTAIKTCIKLLKEERLLTIFPEGTRNKVNDDLQEIKNGAGMIAFKAGAPIVPMYLAKRPKAFRRNKLIIGEPITMEKFSGQKLSSEILDKIGNLLAEKMKSLRNML